MLRPLFAVGCAVTLACAAAAQEPKLVQPKLLAAPPKAEAAKRLAEEVESLEAHLQTKKAYIAAAQVAVKAAEWQVQKVAGVADKLEEAKLGFEAAKAHLLVRETEANEVAVKLKHAKRRAGDAVKADDHAAAQRKHLEAELALAKKGVAIAEAQYDRLVEAAKRGIVSATEIVEAKLKVERAELEVKRLADALAAAGGEKR